MVRWHWGQSFSTPHSYYGIKVGLVFLGVVVAWTLSEHLKRKGFTSHWGLGQR